MEMIKSYGVNQGNDLNLTFDHFGGQIGEIVWRITLNRCRCSWTTPDLGA
jgi:hypothetical protein